MATDEPTFVSIQFDRRDLPRLAQAVAVARNIVSDRAATAKAGHPIITDDVLLHALYGELHKAARPRQENPMTTEQMDEKDREYNYVGITAQSLVDGNVSELASDEHFTSENVSREHVEGKSCWCNPTVEYVPALCDDPDCPRPHRHVEGDEPAERDMSITDVTSYSEDTMFKVQAAITSLGYSGQPVLDLIGAMQNAGVLFREHGPAYFDGTDSEGKPLSDTWTGEPQHPESKRLDPADWPIPRYAMLDIWMALYGAENSQKFEEFADKHGFAETWAQICSMIRAGEYDPNWREYPEDTPEEGITITGLKPGISFYVNIDGGETTILPDDEQGFEDDGLESHKWVGEPQHPESTRITDQEEHAHYTDRATRLCAEGDHDSAVMWDRDAERVKVRESEATLVASAGWCTPSDQVYSFLPTAKEAKAARKARKKAKKARRKARKEGRVLFDEWTVKRGGIQFVERTRDDEPERTYNDETTMAEEPIEDRLRRAWLNGFKDGVDRASYATTESTGRWDY